jgi:ADP-ribose pyrophosphatase
MAFEIIHSEIKYKGRAFIVRKERIRLPDGQIADIDVVAHPGAVTILPLDADLNVLFVQQYRHPAKRQLLELPAGTLEIGENPDQCAAREIREEVGMSANKMVKLTECYMVPGYSSEYMHIYLATGLEPDPLPGDDDEFLKVVKIPYAKSLEMIEKGELPDVKSIAALLLARPYLA